MASDNMQDIKRRIKSVTSTEHITNAMKLVSAGKLRKAKAIFEKTNENSHYITHTIAEIFNNSKEIPEHYLAGNREIKTTCYIVVTSCRGLCGGFNTNVLKAAQHEIDLDWEEPLIIAIGDRGKEYFEKRGYNVYSDYLAPPENISFLETREMSAPVIDMYNRGEIDEVMLIYTSFISSMEQEVKTVTLLPFEIESDPDMRQWWNRQHASMLQGVPPWKMPQTTHVRCWSSFRSTTTEQDSLRSPMRSSRSWPVQRHRNRRWTDEQRENTSDHRTCNRYKIQGRRDA